MSIPIEKIIKSNVDTNKYHTLVLENGVEVLLVSNPAFTKASCAVSVGVGSYDEPIDVPGIAHFLEHMLFMGTKNYPGENDFQNYLSMHNGYTNAYTADEMTVYYSDIEAVELPRLTAMLAEFFICPLFLAGAVEREISAVHSEYLNSLNYDSWRVAAVLGEFVRGGDARGRFNCGNADTLRLPDIRERMIAFWEQKYSSDLMKVVICGPHTIDEMAGIAQAFGDVRRVEGRTVADDATNIDPIHLGSLIRMAPLDDKRQLFIFVNIPATLHLYRKNPLDFLESVFTSEEKTGLLSALKTKGWGFGVGMDAEQFRGFTTVKLTIDLTEGGSCCSTAVLEFVLEWFARADISRVEYERVARIRREEFSMKLPGDALDLAEEAAAAMQHFPVENVLSHDYVYEEYDESLIRRMRDAICDYKRWMIILSDKGDKQTASLFDRQEKYYKVDYCVTGLFEPSYEHKLRIACSDAVVPCKKADVFLSCEDFAIVRLGKRFVKSETRKDTCLSYVFDEEFGIPQAYVFILLELVDVREYFTATQLLIALVEDVFCEENARALENRHIAVSMLMQNNGLLIKIKGVSAGIPEVVSMLCSALEDISTERFNLFKQERIAECTGEIASAPWLRICRMLSQCDYRVPTAEERLDRLRAVDALDLRLPELRAASVVVVGNMKYESAAGIYETVDGMFNSHRRAVAEGCGCAESVEKMSEEVITFKTLDAFNNGIGLFYLTADFTDYAQTVSHERIMEVRRASAIGRLFHQIAADDFFNQLRTVEELGYHVAVSVMSTARREFLAFVVQSEKPVEFVEQRIMRFVGDMMDSIRNMDQETFNTHKESLIGWYEQPTLTLEAFSNYVYAQSINQAIALGFNEAMIGITEKLTKDDLICAFSLFNEPRKVYSYRE